MPGLFAGGANARAFAERAQNVTRSMISLLASGKRARVCEGRVGAGKCPGGSFWPRLVPPVLTTT